ncbi:MAG: aminotransferase class V-fold PLP-dependent enzyme [Candidatus Dojkabacteria bacterium]
MIISKILFPTLNNSELTYLDSASTTQKPKVVLDAIQSHLSELNVNPGRGSYDPTSKLEKEIESIRNQTANFINAENKEIVFTSGATEGLNTVAYSWGLHNLEDGDEILLCEEDHESTVKPWFQIKKLFEKQGINIFIKYYKHHQYLGNADLESIKNELTDKTRLIVVTHIHNVHGTVSDMKVIRKLAGDQVLILLDACQSISHIQIDVKELDIDFLVFSGHKMFALDNIGVLFANQNINMYLQPFIVGGKNIIDKHDLEEKGVEIYKILEAGSQNVTGLKSLEAAINFIQGIGYDEIHKYINELTKYLYEQLSQLGIIEFLAGYAFDQSRIGYGLISFRVHGVSSTDIGELLNQHQIYVRTGNHCTSNGKHTSDSIRVSMHIYNSKDDIDKLISVLKTIH